MNNEISTDLPGNSDFSDIELVTAKASKWGAIIGVALMLLGIASIY